MLPTQHRHATGLQVLERAAEVEKCLGAGAHGDDRVDGEGVEVGGDVAGHLGIAMDTTNPARREHGDAGGGSERDGGAHGGRPEVPALGDGDSEITLGGLACRSQDALVLLRVDADAWHTVEHGGDGRDRTGATDRRHTALQGLGVTR